MEGSPEEIQVRAFLPGAEGGIHDDCVCPQPALLPERAYIAPHKVHLRVATSLSLAFFEALTGSLQTYQQD